MTELTIAEIIRRVRANIDEVRSNESELAEVDGDVYATTDEEDINSIIRGKLQEALVYVYGNAEPSLLEPTSVTDFEYDRDLDCFYIDFEKSDYLGFVSAWCESWEHAVTKPILRTDKAYSMQFNPLTKGTKERPVVTLADLSGGSSLRISLFSPDGANQDSACLLYVPYPTVDDVDNDEVTVDVMSKLVEAFIYYVTALTMLVLGDKNGDSMMMQAHVEMGRGEAGNPNNTQQ